MSVGQDRAVKKMMQQFDPDEIVCDRCGRLPGRIGFALYCFSCSHECTFTRSEATDQPKEKRDPFYGADRGILDPLGHSDDPDEAATDQPMGAKR